MTRVLMVHPSPDRYGSDRVFLESVTALRANGFAVEVSIPDDGPLTELLRADGVTVRPCPSPVLRKAALRPLGFLRLLAGTVRAIPPALRLVRRADVVYVNTVTLPLWPVLARLAGRRVLVHVHEAEESVPAPVRLLLAAPMLAAHRVVVNSQATAGALGTALSRLRERCVLVYNGVSLPGGSTVDAPVPVEPADPARVVLVGRLSPRKGTDLAIDAVALLRSAGHRVTLDVVGAVFPGYEWYERDLRAVIERHGLGDSVRLHGFHDDVGPTYRAADIAIVPSRVEPFGNTAVEAQLAGVPVVVTDVQGLPEAVDGGRSGRIVAPDDAGALADGIAAVLADWPAAARTAERARTHARAVFAPQRYRDEVATAVADLAGGSAATPAGDGAG